MRLSDNTLHLLSHYGDLPARRGIKFIIAADEKSTMLIKKELTIVSKDGILFLQSMPWHGRSTTFTSLDDNCIVRRQINV